MKYLKGLIRLTFKRLFRLFRKHKNTKYIMSYKDELKLQDLITKNGDVVEYIKLTSGKHHLWLNSKYGKIRKPTNSIIGMIPNEK